MQCFKVQTADRNYSTTMCDFFLVVAEDFASAEALAETKLKTCHVIKGIESLGECFLEESDDS